MSVPSAPVITVAPFSSNQKLEFAWSPPTSDGGSPITGYRFQLGAETPVDLGANVLYYRATGLTNNTSYIGSIEAQNTNGYSSKSYFREFRPGSAAPAAPATASASTEGSSSAVVSWTAPGSSPDSDVLWYVINSVSSNPADPVLKATGDGQLQTSYLLDGLNPNSSYSFDVQAVNCPGYSPALRTGSIAWFSGGQAKLATRSGGATTHEFSTVAVDSTGNVYQLVPLTNTNTITIYSYSSAPVGGGEIGTSVYGTITAGAQGNIILIKYNSEGTVQWATKFERFQSGDLPPAIATDGSGNVYVSYANYNQSTVTFYNYSSAPSGGGAVGLTNYGTLSSPNGLIMCIAKYNPSGTVIWATKVATNGLSARFPFMNTDVNGNVYFGVFVGDSTTTISSFSSAPGSAGGAINLSTYGTYTKIGTYDTVIVKYNPSGVAQWVTALSNIATGTIDLVGGFAANSSGDVYVSCSSMSSTVTIRSFTSGGDGGAISTGSWGTISTSSGTGRGAVVVKYNSSGTPVWVTRMVPVSSVVVRTTPYLSLDVNGNLYWMAGIVFAGTLTLYNYTSGGGGDSSITTTAYGTVDAGASQNFTPLIVKFNSSGTIQWANSVKGPSAIPYKSVCDSTGNFYLACYANDKLPVFNYTSAPSGAGPVGLTLYGYVPPADTDNDIYIVKYNSSGTVQWGSSVAGTAAENYAALDIDGLGNVWITGTYKSSTITVNKYSSAPVSQGDMTLTAFGTLADIAGAGDNVFLVKYAV